MCLTKCLGEQAVAMTALVNLFAAEVLTNIHSFIIVVPNHAGEDVYRFKTPVKVRTHTHTHTHNYKHTHTHKHTHTVYRWTCTP